MSPPRPDVDVVIATRDRPELVRRAIRSVLEQDYEGRIQCTLVFDRSELDLSLVDPGERRSVQVVRNERTPGLAGARNTGILQGRAPLVAFCDDDDEWLPQKLTRQVTALDGHPSSVLACTGIEIVRDGVVTPRVLERRTVGLDELIRSRVTELHPSTFLLRRNALAGELGLVQESVPHGYGEDYDLLLRAASIGPVISVPQVLARIHWHPDSYFAHKWEPMADGLSWLLEHHPELGNDRKGWARVAGQVAFARAAHGRRSLGSAWALRTLRRDPAQARGWLALAVAARILPPDRVMRTLNARGRGI
ncbi:glycosyltransferase family 2 protein [Angustibacter sp. McL0619]|uniref:glycosyltransferase family 2 protein n=1 Tax=Angustibacter sp. McL0619 TaxID=3415676 RepID=UPI003CF9555C